MKQQFIKLILIEELKMKNNILFLMFFTLLNLPVFSENYYILLDPGHGGYDGGASGACGIPEKALNLDYSTYAHSIILNDITTDWFPRRTRNNDTYISPEDRAHMANNDGGNWFDADGFAIPINGVDFFLSIHCNSSTSQSSYGSEVWYHNANNPRGIKSKIAATVELQTFLYKTKEVFSSAYSRWVKESGTSIWVLYNTNMPSCLVETEFINNPSICSVMITENYKNAVAEGLGKGIKYLDKNAEYFVNHLIYDDITEWTNWTDGGYLIENTNAGSTQYYYVENWLDISQDVIIIVDDNVHFESQNNGFINRDPFSELILGQGASFDGSVNPASVFNLIPYSTTRCNFFKMKSDK